MLTRVRAGDVDDREVSDVRGLSPATPVGRGCASVCRIAEQDASGECDRWRGDSCAAADQRVDRDPVLRRMRARVREHDVVFVSGHDPRRFGKAGEREADRADLRMKLDACKRFCSWHPSFAAGDQGYAQGAAVAPAVLPDASVVDDDVEAHGCHHAAPGRAEAKGERRPAGTADPRIRQRVRAHLGTEPRGWSCRGTHRCGRGERMPAAAAHAEQPDECESRARSTAPTPRLCLSLSSASDGGRRAGCPGRAGTDR